MTESSQPRHRRWRIGELIVDEPSLQLFNEGRVLTSESAQVLTLIALIEAWPEIIDKNQLIDRVWGQRLVSDAAVHKTISLLRRQLRRVDAEGLIETRHRLGYRLIQQPELLEKEKSSAEPLTPPASVARRSGRLSVAAVAFLLLAVMVFWQAKDRSEPMEFVEDAGSNPEATSGSNPDYTQLLGERDFQALLDLIRVSLPADMELAEQALDEASLRVSAGSVGVGEQAMLEKYFGILHFYRSEHQQAIERWERALEGFRAVDDRHETANVLTNLGAALEERDAPAERIAGFYDQALELRRELDDPEGLMRTLNNLATLWIGRGQVQPARAAVEELSSLADSLNEPVWQIRASLLSGDIDSLLPGVDSVSAYRRAHEQATRHGRVQDASVAAQRLARSFGDLGEWDLQRQWLERARRHLQAAGLVARLPIIDYALGLNHERQADPEEARVAYRSVLDQLPEGESIHLAVDAEVGLARLDFQAGQERSARERIQRALRLARINDHRLAEASALLAGGFMDLAETDGTAAAFAAVAEIRERLEGDVPFGIQHHLLRLEALALVGNGRSVEAREVLVRLQSLARTHGHRAALLDSRLIESIALFAEGRFDQGWRAHQSALGQTLVPIPVDETGVSMTTESMTAATDRSSLWSIAAVGIFSFVVGWFLSFRRRSDQRTAGR